MKSTRTQITQVSSGSMADIAFLLLIFFLVTTTILQDKGLTIRLPAKVYEASTLNVQERNLFKININSKDDIMVEGEIWNKSLDDLQIEAKRFVMNYNKDIAFSESPEKAIISYKTSRGTSYNKYIQVLDKLKGAYYDIYGNKVGLTAAEYRNLRKENIEEYQLYKKGKEGIPMNISIAEPTL